MWETGVLGSLYSPLNWRISAEFLDPDWVRLGFNTPESQLQHAVQALHAMGKAVGTDILPHTDAFSEIVLTYPHYFEWIHIDMDTRQQDFAVHPNLGHVPVEALIEAFAQHQNRNRHQLFDGPDRGPVRQALIDMVTQHGWFPAPVTERYPLRPIRLVGWQDTPFGEWPQFGVPSQTDEEAVVFGSITPYKWYALDAEGIPITSEPQEDVFEYFLRHVETFIETYDFDFIRADMAHNQLAYADGVFDVPKREIWRELKSRIQAKKPHFGVFAEAFFKDTYIDVYEDLTQKQFDVVLGYANYVPIGPEYIKHVKDSLEIADYYSFSPCLATITNDSDQSPHAHLYACPQQNLVRYFTNMFLPLPSYCILGFEQRDTENPDFSFLFLQQQDRPYRWGQNHAFFEQIQAIRAQWSAFSAQLTRANFDWVQCENPNILAWHYLLDTPTHPESLVFIVNFSDQPQWVEDPLPQDTLTWVWGTEPQHPLTGQALQPYELLILRVKHP